MKLSQLGEFGLIDRIAKRESQLVTTVVGIGDDAAVIQISKIKNEKLKTQTKKQKYLLVTTDTLIENIHFKLKTTSFFNLGYKALAANISDIAAMGGWPTHALVTVGLPKGVKVEAVDDLYRGINRLAKKYKIDIIGGDTVQSPKEIVISVTLLGEVEKENLLLRSTAKIGDAILVTGDFGGPAAEKFILRSLSLVCRIREARIIAESKLATSMIDSSDGLVRSVLEICRASRVGARIWLDSVPVAKKATLDHALYGGEEYELVFTAPRSKAVELKGLIEKRTKVKVSIVGEVVSRRHGIKLVDLHGRVFLPKSGGYEHFKNDK